MDSKTYLAVAAGIAISQVLERLIALLRDWAFQRRKETAERRKTVLDATVALVTAKQQTGKDYYAGDVSRLFTRLAYLMENDGSAWDRARFHAEATGTAFSGLQAATKVDSDEG